MHNRIVSIAVLAGFAAVAVVAGLAIHVAGVAFGVTGGSLNEPFDAVRGYSPGFSLVVLLTLAGAGVLSMAAYHLSHTRRTAARVRVRSAQSGRDLEGLRPHDRRRG